MCKPEVIVDHMTFAEFWWEMMQVHRAKGEKDIYVVDIKSATRFKILDVVKDDTGNIEIHVAV